MGHSCSTPDEDGGLEVAVDVSFPDVQIPARRRRVKTLHTDSPEALEAETNPFTEDLRRTLTDEPGRVQSASSARTRVNSKDDAAVESTDGECDACVQGVNTPAPAHVTPKDRASTQPASAAGAACVDGTSQTLPQVAPKGDSAALAWADPTADATDKSPDGGGGGASRNVVLAPAGRPSVQALAFPYCGAPALGEIVGGERAEYVDECGDFVQVRWNGLKVWVAREDANCVPAELKCDSVLPSKEDAPHGLGKQAYDSAPASEDTDAGGCAPGGLVSLEEPSGVPLTGCKGSLADEGAVWSVGQAVDLRANGWIPAKITGALSSGLVQVRSVASSSQAAEDGVEAQCGVWLDRQQQRELLRPRSAPALP